MEKTETDYRLLGTAITIVKAMAYGGQGKARNIKISIVRRVGRALKDKVKRHVVDHTWKQGNVTAGVVPFLLFLMERTSRNKYDEIAPRAKGGVLALALIEGWRGTPWTGGEKQVPNEMKPWFNEERGARRERNHHITCTPIPN